MGPGARDESGKLVPLDVKAGDRAQSDGLLATHLRVRCNCEAAGRRRSKSSFGKALQQSRRLGLQRVASNGPGKSFGQASVRVRSNAIEFLGLPPTSARVQPQRLWLSWTSPARRCRSMARREHGVAHRRAKETKSGVRLRLSISRRT